MNIRSIGFWIGIAGFLLTMLIAPPVGMPPKAWFTAGLVWWMAAWWMTEALPLSATAILPFLALPMLGVADANKTAAAYYSPIMFLIIGGAFMALAVERTGLHRRLALAILSRSGSSPLSLLLAVMGATALISMFISNTSTALIMMPMALAMLAAGGIARGETEGMAGALPMGISFAASVGGLGTIVGSPTNALSVGMLEESLGIQIGFAEWSLYGLPVVLLGVPLACLVIARVQRLGSSAFDPAGARAAIGERSPWTLPERRLVPVMVLAVLAWVLQPWLETLLPKGALTDGTIAAVAGLALLILPDGTGRRLLTWNEANGAPWDVMLMFGGGLALAMGMAESGLAQWLGQMLLPLSSVPLIVVTLVVVAVVVVITEFASNIATASGIMPVVAALVVGLGADPILLAMPAALAASLGLMLPSGSGPNAIAWSTGHIALPRALKAGFLFDISGAILIVGVVWGVEAMVG